MANTTLQNLESYLASSGRVKEYIEASYEPNSLLLTDALSGSQYSFSNPSLMQIKHQVDSVLNHYGILFIGALSGYFPYDFNDAVKNEMVRFLEIEAVREYYAFKRKCFLPEAIGAYCSAIDFGNTQPYYNDGVKVDDYFNAFLMLNRLVWFDEDILAFLEMIDNGSAFTEPGFMNMFTSSSGGLMTAMLNSDMAEDETIKKPEPAIGAIHFAYFIAQLKGLLDDTQSIFEPQNTVLQSAIWHFYGYYFETVNGQLSDLYDAVFEYLFGLVNKEIINLREKNDEESKGRLLLASELYRGLVDARFDVTLVLNQQTYAPALKKAAENQLSNTSTQIFVPFTPA